MKPLTSVTQTVVLAALFAMLFFGSLASAQTINVTGTTNSGRPVALCTTITHSLGVGSHDYYTGGDVTALQNYLYARGYFNYQSTGYYGTLTAASLANWQRDNSIAAVGVVGPLTRAAIASASCNGGVVPPPQASAPVIYSMTPTQGPVGTTVSITGFGFSANNTIMFGNGAISNVPITSSIAIACTTNPNCHGGINQTLTFVIPQSVGAYCQPNQACPMWAQLITPGTYNISVVNQNGTSASIPFNVTSTQTTTSVPTIYSVTPTQGPVGTTVSIVGSGFSGSNMVVHFGSGYVANATVTSSTVVPCASANQNCNAGATQTITFSVPQYIGPYCKPGNACALWVQQVLPGTYNLSVQNDNGTSTTIPFTVTQ